VKCGLTETTQATLEFGVNPAIFLSKDADGSIPLHIAVQNTSPALAELLIQYGPTEQLYMENSVGQTPLEIAGLKFLPRVTGFNEAPQPTEPRVNVVDQVPGLIRAALFDLEKQKVEIPKLCTTLSMLVADGRLVPGTKLATELFAFADRMVKKLAIETATRKDVAKDAKKDNEVDPTIVQRGTTADMYVVLRDAVAARPGPRHLAHLADVQRSVQASCTWAKFSNWTPQVGEEERSKQTDPEVQRIAQLKQRSLFGWSASTSFGQHPLVVNFFGEEHILAPVGQPWRDPGLFWSDSA
jgi:hypothetical protein